MPDLEGQDEFWILVQGRVQFFILVIEAYRQGVLTLQEVVGFLVDFFYQIEGE